MNASAGNGAAETGAAQTAASTERPAASVLIVDDDKWTTRAVAARSGTPGRSTSSTRGIPVRRRSRPTRAPARPRAHGRQHAPGDERGGCDAGDHRARPLGDDRPPHHGGARARPRPSARGRCARGREQVRLRCGAHPRRRGGPRGDSPEPLRTLAEDILVSGDSVPDVPANAPALTEAELTLLRQICEGLDYSEIAARQFVTVHTVKSHARNLRIKLGAKNLAQVVIRAVQFKFHSPE